ncbi:hypothetical protein AB3S75_023432 [Citrus x aurantiifolia]
MKHSLYEERGIKKSMYFPGNEIPKWFRHQMFPAFLKYFRHKSGEDDWDGNVYAVCCDWKRKSEGHLGSWFLGKISYVESDHLFLGCNSFGGALGHSLVESGSARQGASEARVKMKRNISTAT